MKKMLTILCVLIAASAAVAKPQTNCPVMGGKINNAHYADVDGYRIYVCCRPCIAKVKADPQKYIKQMKDAGVELEKTPAKE